MTKLPPHPKNAKGDFYVEDGCCTACDLPREEAPDLFRYEDMHCYVCRQPSTDADVVRILNAMEIQDLDCIQYKGNNPYIIQSLKQRNLESCISSNMQVLWAKLKSKLGVR
ncbi:hypothetical protein TDB9533_03710 [Thalassocella blandensis]|nr:hypothetical protein TDB9533_03710 [Thalassocella blandensis]